MGDGTDQLEHSYKNGESWRDANEDFYIDHVAQCQLWEGPKNQQINGHKLGQKARNPKTYSLCGGQESHFPKACLSICMSVSWGNENKWDEQPLQLDFVHLQGD